MPMGRRKKCFACLKSNALTLLTIMGVATGVILGAILKAQKSEWSQREVMYVTYPGELFLRMLKALILPLIVSSLVSAVGSLDLSLSGKIGARAVLYYVTTTILAVILGIILVSSIRPGGQGEADKITRSGSSRNVTTADTLMDLARNMFPPNLVQAAIAQYRTVLIPPTDKHIRDKYNLTEGEPLPNGTKFDLMNDMENGNMTYSENGVMTYITDGNMTYTENGNMTYMSEVEKEIERFKKDLYAWKIDSEYTMGTNIMGLVVFATILGITLGKMKERGKPLLDFFTALSEAMMVITNWVIWLSPIGVLFLIAGKVIEIESYSVIVGQLGYYFVTVLCGLFGHGLIVLPILFAVITRTLPFRFILNMVHALVTAFGTASSSATLPITIGCLEDKNHVDPRVARFVLPIGATINMDGTALYEAVAALFIAQVRQVPLSFGAIIAVSITATAASVGAAGIPQAGLVTMVMVLDTVGLPAEDVTLIIAVDWLLDRFRTTINVLGDSLGAGLVNHLSKKELSAMEQQQQGIEGDVEKGDLMNGKPGSTENPTSLDEYQTTSM